VASVNVKSAEFEGLIEKGGIMLVDFWAEWCGPCRMFGPVYEKVSEEFLYREAGALPEPSLRELISSIQAVNMDDIRKQIAEEAAQQSAE
jgi:thioredoxin 1